MNIALFLFLTSSEIALTMVRNNASSGYSVPYCDSEIGNVLSFNLLLKTLHFTVVVRRLFTGTMVAKVAF